MEKHEFNWKQIAEEWLSGTYDPIKCREIYHSLPSEEYDHLSGMALSFLDPATDLTLQLRNRHIIVAT